VRALLPLAALALLGCAHPRSPAAFAVTRTTSHVAARSAGPYVTVADEILSACHVRFSDVAASPHLAAERLNLAASDRDVLEQVAACLVSGPLAGRAVHVAGASHAHAVTSFLVSLGVDRTDIRETGRAGAMVAGGEADPRVDVSLE
jgi:hypothetical protein